MMSSAFSPSNGDFDISHSLGSSHYPIIFLLDSLTFSHEWPREQATPPAVAAVSGLECRPTGPPAGGCGLNESARRKHAMNSFLPNSAPHDRRNPQY
jgi:hypothetical protein